MTADYMWAFGSIICVFLPPRLSDRTPFLPALSFVSRCLCGNCCWRIAVNQGGVVWSSVCVCESVCGVAASTSIRRFTVPINPTYCTHAHMHTCIQASSGAADLPWLSSRREAATSEQHESVRLTLISLSLLMRNNWQPAEKDLFVLWLFDNVCVQRWQHVLGKQETEWKTIKIKIPSWNGINQFKQMHLG